MKKIFTTFVSCYLAINSFGQVSIGNPNTPHQDVILDLTNFGNKGLLLPNLGTAPKKPLANIFYDSSKNMIGVVVDTTVSNYGINYLSPWKHTDENSDVTLKSDLGKVIINYTGSLTTKVILEVNDGDLEVNDGDVNVQDGKIKEYGHDLVPQGAIIMWSGAITDIPPGWSLCDGTEAYKLDGNVSFFKPDLRERFIVGAGTTDNADVSNSTEYAIGAGGNGNNSIEHTHDVNPANFVTNPTEGYHRHSGTTGGTGIPGNGNASGGDSAPNAHTHNVQTTYAAHVHNINLPNKTSTVCSTSENRPPYYALAFIIKL